MRPELLIGLILHERMIELREEIGKHIDATVFIDSLCLGAIIADKIAFLKIFQFYEKMEDLLIPKKEDPYFPLACYLKWGFKAVNTEYLEKLTKTNSKNF